MKKLVGALIYLTLVGMVLGNWNHAYLAREADDTYVTKKRCENQDLDLQQMWKIYDDDGNVVTQVLCYVVYVTQAEFDGGWNSVPAQKKSDAKDAAEDWAKDYEDWGTKDQAIIDALFEEINNLRTNAAIGLPAYSKQEIKNKIKNKKKKPKDK